MFLIRRPPVRQIERFLAASSDLPLSYEPIGLARTSATGFSVDEQVGTVGRGPETFARAVAALQAWKQFDVGWIQIFPAGAAIAPGTVVAVLARHLGIWSLNGCRIVYLTGNAGTDQFGFAYGTLTNHAEAGEEIFSVALDASSGDVTYTIRAVSRPRATLARLGYPLARRLQARFRADSLAAMRRAVGNPSNGL